MNPDHGNPDQREKDAPVPPARVAVVGAGVAGLSCARHLQDAGCTVVVFDKGRVPGGRLATRETSFGPFDHGAQFFTVRDDAFAEEITRREADGVVAEWTGHIAYLSAGETAPARPARRLVGVPRMASLAETWARGLDLRPAEIERLRRAPDGWTLGAVGGDEACPFDRVVLALPVTQARPLLPTGSALAEEVSEDRVEACLAGLFTFETALPVPWDAAFVDGHALTWLARDASRPGRPSGERWVLHASHDWSVARLGSSDETRRRDLLAALAQLVAAPLPDIAEASVHRWRSARPAVPRRAGSLHDRSAGLALCGDWCHGARVEGAWLSGRHAALRLLGRDG